MCLSNDKYYMQSFAANPPGELVILAVIMERLLQTLFLVSQDRLYT